MATSPQYCRRDTSTQRWHDQTYQNLDGHMYAALVAPPWSGHVPQEPGPPSVHLDRSTSSSAQQPVHPFASVPYAVDYVNPLPVPVPWSASYVRQSLHGWPATPSDESFTSRSSMQYGEAGHEVPVPQPNATRARQPRHASNAASDVQLSHPDHAFRAAEQQPELRVPPEFSAPTSDQPFPHHAQRSAPVSHILNYPAEEATALQLNPTELPSQAPVSWTSAPNPNLPATGHNYGHRSDALSSAVTASAQGVISSPQWEMGNPGTDISTAPALGRVHEIPTEFPTFEGQSGTSAFAHNPTQIEHMPPAVYGPPPPPARSGRRSTNKKGAKVPASYTQRQAKLKTSKRHGPLTTEGRQKASHMRKEASPCVRCRFFRVGCDEGTPCTRCLKVKDNARSFREPCCRDHIDDTSLVRHCNGRFSQEEAEFMSYNWAAGSDIYEMEFVWNLPGFGPIAMDQPLRTMIRQYVPTQDTHTSYWRNNKREVIAVQQAPYAVYDPAGLVQQFERWFWALQPYCEKWIFDRAAHDHLAMLTYREVHRVRDMRPRGPNNLLDLAMRMQCLSVVSQGYGTVWSNNIPGIQEIDFKKLGRSSYEAYNRDSRERPLPQSIDHQMDVASLKLNMKTERQFRKQLKDAIFKSGIRPWYEVFLALFVILWNLEYIHGGAEGYIMSKNGTSIENQVSNVVRNQILRWKFSAQVLFYHWRCVIRDFAPFQLARENPEELRMKGHIDAQGFAYMMHVVRYFDQMGENRLPSSSADLPTPHDSMTSSWIRKLFEEAGA